MIADEVSALDFRSVAKNKFNGWFRAYLKSKGVTDDDFGSPIDELYYPAAAMFEKTFRRKRAAANSAACFITPQIRSILVGQQLRQISDLIQGSLPGMKTEILLPSHGFFGNAWGSCNIGMSYRMLDIFELGKQQSVSQLSAEDWLGLNHMYGADYTWTGGQTFGYFNAMIRSAIAEKPIM